MIDSLTGATGIMAERFLEEKWGSLRRTEVGGGERHKTRNSK